MNLRAISLVCAVTGLLVGCSDDKTGTATPTSTASTSSAAADPFTSFDPCKDIPADFIKREGLDNQPPDPEDTTSGNLRWKGCDYQQREDYDVAIDTTNMTLDVMEQRHTNEFRRLQIGGRPAAIEGPDRKLNACTLLVEMKGGGLWVYLKNSFAVEDRVDPCQTAIDLTTKIVQFLPADS